VVLYIQRASEARRSYASVVNVATRFDGNREGTLLDIDANNLAEFIDEFYDECDVDPSEVEFVEAYGCALKVSTADKNSLAHEMHRRGNERVSVREGYGYEANQIKAKQFA
jgi:fatty acid synthase